MALSLQKARELRGLYKEALNRLSAIPSWEKQRCIENLERYMAMNRPITELKAFKQHSFEIKWKVCAVRIINGEKPFEHYKPELLGIY